VKLLQRVGNAEDVLVRFRAPVAVAPVPTLDDDIDLVAVERALGGESPPVQLTDAEARFAWQLIHDPDTEIYAAELADLLGVSSRTVVRWRSARRTGAGS
jgi:hypothetical protein